VEITRLKSMTKKRHFKGKIWTIFHVGLLWKIFGNRGNLKQRNASLPLGDGCTHWLELSDTKLLNWAFSLEKSVSFLLR